MYQLTNEESSRLHEKQEQIEKVAKEARLIELSKLALIKVGKEVASKAGVDPKALCSSKGGKELLKQQDAEYKVLQREHLEKLKKKRFDQCVWSNQNRLKPEKITDIIIYPNTRPVTITVYRNNDRRNLMFTRTSSLVILIRKRKALELEHEVRIAGLECDRSLSEGVKFVNNKVIEIPEHGIFFINAFGNIRTPKTQRFCVMMRKMIDECPDKDKLQSKRIRLEALGYSIDYVNILTYKFLNDDLVDKRFLSVADNRPPMLEKDMYDSWKSIMELYMMNRQHGRMILESVENGPLIWPTIEENGVTRPKKYSELSATEAIQADCDIKATHIILQGVPPEVYALVSNHKFAKELWERIQLLMQGTSLTKQERECKLYDEFDKFAYKKGETLRDFYLRFSLLLNDMNIYNMKLEQFQVNTKFLNTLPPEWSKFVTDVKLVRDLHTTNIDQLHAYLGQHEFHANEGRQTSFAAGTTRTYTPGAIGSNSGKQRTVICYNCKGEGHMSKQFTKPKRKRDDSWFKDKVLLVQAQANGQILHEEELAFLADLRIAEAALVESKVVNHSETEIPVIAIFIPYSSFQNPFYLKKAQQLEPKLYDSNVIKNTSAIVIPNSEKTPMLAEEEVRIIFQRDNYVSIQRASSLINISKNELKAQSQEKDTVIKKLKERIKSLSGKMNEDKIKKDLEEIETINIELDHRVSKLIAENEHLKQTYKQLYDSIKPARIRSKEQCDDLINQVNLKSVEISDLNASLQEKVLVITALKDELSKLKGKALADNVVCKHTIDPEMLKIDVEYLNPRLLNNRSAHSDYLKHTQEEAAILREIVEQGKSQNPLNESLDSACKYTKQIQELLIIVGQTCPSINNSGDKLVAVIPKNKDKRVRFTEPVTSSGNTNTKTASSSNLVSNKPMLSSTGVKTSTSASGSQPSGNTKKDKIQRTPIVLGKNKGEAHPDIKSSLKNKNSVVEPKGTANVQHSKLNANSEPLCVKCNGCMLSDNHDLCVLDFINDVNARTKSKSTFTIVRNACPLTRITTTAEVPLRKPTALESDTPKPVVVQIVLWYLDSGCSKHMTRDRSQLTNFVNKFLGTVKFGNDHVAKILGYGDYQIGNVTISRVYYVEGLGHNLFSVGQFCDSNLEVAFRQHTCFIRNLEGVDLLTGSRGNNLYTLSLGDMMASSPICLLSKASKTKSWLWHRRLSHLNFGAINHLARHGLVRGLPKLKFKKDHLCSACAIGKSKKKPHKPKSEDTNQEKLYLLHMDLCGPMRVASVNGKKYILVIVNDYSRFTWVKCLRSKDEAPDFIIKFLKMIQVQLKVPVRRIRTDNGTEFVNQTLREYYEKVGISYETSVARSP
ncbi:retrovirus-related pol polyprotein from transposon TNT 1-94 [Tanacetum coccineum]